MRFHSRFMEIIVSLIIQLVNCSRQLFVSVCLRLKSSYMPKKIQFAQSQRHKRGTFIHPAVTQNKITFTPHKSSRQGEKADRHTQRDSGKGSWLAAHLNTPQQYLLEPCIVPKRPVCLNTLQT